MSGISIQNKIDKALGKVGKKLGKPFDVFHPTSANNPLQQNNYLCTATIWFEQQNHKGDDIIHLTYMNVHPDKWTQIQIGDYFNNVESNETYYIYQKPFNVIEVQSILCTDMVDVQRTIYVDAESSLSTIYTKVPVRIVSDSSFGGSHYVPASTYFEDSLQKYTIYSGAPQGSFNKDDILIDELGNKMVITDAVWNGHYIMKGQSYAPTSQN